MHYADGTEVKLGDVARTVANLEHAKTGPQVEFMGVVVGGTPNSSGCNVQFQLLATRTISPLGTSGWTPVSQPYPQCFTASECLKVV